MKNILATWLPQGLSASHAMTWFLIVSTCFWTGWGVWATRSITEVQHRQIVSVRLAQVMGDFVAAEARSGRPPEETRARVTTYLQAVQASVAALGANGRTVLVAEAVVAGGVPDLTDQLRADVAHRMEALARAAR